MTTINTIEDLARILRDQATWAEALRALLLTQELLDLPGRFDRFVEAQREFNQAQQEANQAKQETNRLTDQRLNAIEGRMDRVEGQLGNLQGGQYERPVRTKAFHGSSEQEREEPRNSFFWQTFTEPPGDAIEHRKATEQFADQFLAVMVAQVFSLRLTFGIFCKR